MSRMISASSSNALLLAILVTSTISCESSDRETEYVPVPVSVSALTWHKDDIPDRLLELRGYYSIRSRSGLPSIYSSEADALMLNDAEAYPISFVDENLVKNSSCEAGYVKAFGFLDVEHDVFRVFVMGGFGTDWQESEACWATSFDWQNYPGYSHLVPGP